MAEERGFDMAPHLVPLAAALCDDRIKKLLVVCGPGCLTGDTIVGVERSRFSGLRKMTLAELYHKFNGILTAPAFTLSWTGDRLAMNQIKSVIQSGVKPVYLLTTTGGLSIKASADHPFLVPATASNRDEEGYKKLSAFIPGTRSSFETRNHAKATGLLKKTT